MHPYLQALQGFKRKQYDLFAALEQLNQALAGADIDEDIKEKSRAALHKIRPADQLNFSWNVFPSSNPMNDASWPAPKACSMKCYRCACVRSAKACRDSRAWCATLAHSRGKEVRFDIIGEDTLVDRDILSKIENPLNHLLRNAPSITA